MDSWEGTKPLGKSMERTKQEHEIRGCSSTGWGAEQSLPSLVGVSGQNLHAANGEYTLLAVLWEGEDALSQWGPGSLPNSAILVPNSSCTSSGCSAGEAMTIVWSRGLCPQSSEMPFERCQKCWQKLLKKILVKMHFFLFFCFTHSVGGKISLLSPPHPQFPIISAAI